MKTVVLFKCPDSAAERHKLSGFSAVARERDWNVQTVEPVRTVAEARKVIDFWRPDGVTVSCIAAVNDLPSTAFGPKPVVFLGRPLTRLARTDSFVCLDTRAATELAVHELFRLNLSHYAYVPWDEPTAWNEESESAFADIMSFNGKGHSIFPVQVHRTRRARLEAHEVLELFPCSRRMAEIMFRSVTGQSILSAIRAVRLEKANLLLQTDLKLDAIANFCGYKSAAAFSVFYKAETGRTPRNTREKGLAH